jgi:hypothetical protein
MSLINEALKKAQGERPVQGNAGPPEGSPPDSPGHYVPPPKKDRKSFIWGFILAVFVVGTFTILLSTFFVWQILGPEEERDAVSKQAEVSEQAGPVEAEAAKPVENVQAQLPAAKPVPTEVAREPEPEPVQATEPAPPASPPDPAVIARLMELEIRGIMSGGTRVLIYDQSSGRNKTYRAGDSLEGPMGLVVENISTSSIKFKDYAGQTHTKSF